MPYRAPVRDQVFVINEVLGLEGYANLPGFADVSADLVQQVLEEGGRFCDEVLAPLNPVGDKEGCVWTPEGVKTPQGFKEAYAQMVQGGWMGLGAEPDFGGQGLPAVLNTAFHEMASGANQAFMMYPGLAHGAYSAILAGGSDEQKTAYLPKLVSGEWMGTMNLTEPQCGTDLGLIRTKAVKQADGTYRISGQKIWISGGEQDLTENIIHLVLARIEGAPEGTKGISLFIVPKFLPNPDGSLGARNGVSCAGLEEKMGIHGNATCVMVYDEATGFLVGEENHGLALMFVMMNEARLGVGVQGVALGEAATQAAADFARDRLQGRSPKGPKNPAGPADPIIVYPDVRRMLLDSHALMEGGRALILWTSLQGDLSHRAPDEAARQKAADYMALMTPVVKAFLTDRGFKAASDAVQIHGGSGYTEHFAVSQYLRDLRITMIYEGTNGIQAMDLVGRKLGANGGRAIMSFFADIDALVAEDADNETLKPFSEGLRTVRGQLQEATLWLMQHGLADPDDAGAAATDYLQLFGLTALAYMWRLMAKAADEKVRSGDPDPFYPRKLTVGRYYIERVLPEAGAHLAKLKTGAATIMALEPEAF